MMARLDGKVTIVAGAGGNVGAERGLDAEAWGVGGGADSARRMTSANRPEPSVQIMTWAPTMVCDITAEHRQKIGVATPLAQRPDLTFPIPVKSGFR